MFNSVPMEKFDQKKLAISYGEYRNQNLIELDLADYDPNIELPTGVRFMTVDVQETAPELWYLIREWDKKTSDSRLIAYGSCNTWTELEQIREQHKVKVFNTLVDSGYDTKDVYTNCARAGRWGIMGGKKKWLCYTATKGTTAFEIGRAHV